MKSKFKAGDVIVSLVTLRNGFAEIKAGTTGVLVRHWRGWVIDFLPCPHCGIRGIFSRVQERDFRKKGNLADEAVAL